MEIADIREYCKEEIQIITVNNSRIYYCKEDEQDNYFDYMVVKDIISNEEKLYEGVCYIADNLLVIYK